jgi:hypothetical protein
VGASDLEVSFIGESSIAFGNFKGYLLFRITILALI